MNNKLSATDRQRVSDALTKCAQDTRDIDNSQELAEAAYSILSDRLGDNPGLFKAACQVYNSCKSIHKLASADDSNRGNSFAILNVNAMADRLAAERAAKLRKAASAPATFTRKPIPACASSLQKAASAEVADTRPEAPEVTDNDFKQFLRGELDDLTAFLHKSASSLRFAETSYNNDLEKFVAAFATVGRQLRKDAAARLHANFGEAADELLSKAGELRPLSKVASADYVGKYVGTPSLPDTDIYVFAKSALNSTNKVKRAREDYQFIVKQASEAVVDYARAYLNKKAASAAVTAAPMWANAADKGFLDLIGLGDVDNTADMRKAIFTTEMMNNMISHSYQRSFMKAVTNPAIAKYSLAKSVAAFNRAVAKLPPNTRLVPATANQQLIESLMVDELAKGAVPSKADTEVIATLAQTLGKLQTDKGVYKENTGNDKQSA